MKGRIFLRTSLGHMVRVTVAVLCVAVIGLGDPAFLAGQQPADQSEQAPPIPPDQLDSLVAPIALYPDPLLAQVLAASTYPLEIVQLQQFLAKHPELKDQALVDAVMKEDWDPTVQALAQVPEVVKRLADDIQWTTDLGNAFLAQQSDVMDAVQRMRKKAEDKGTLKSSDKMSVETKAEGGKDVIVIEPANPDVVYVPSYDPVVVYGAPVYPYPPVYYPTGGLLLSFGVGVAMGAAWGGWCCNAGWGGNNVNINNNNNFVRNSNRQTGNRPSGGSGNWQHNPQHRGGTPYRDRATANRYSGTTRGGSTGVGNRPSGGTGVGNRPSGGTGAGNRPSAGTGPGNRPGGGDTNGIGGRDVSRGAGGAGGSGNGFGGGSRGGFNGANAGASGSRGRSSFGGGGGGGRGGGRPSGGGGRRR